MLRFGEIAMTNQANQDKLKSLQWAQNFLLNEKRLPNAIDYDNAGFNDSGQCDCEYLGQCPLNEHKLMTIQCSRTCHANQLV